MTKSWLRYTGIIFPPLSWAISTRLGQVTPYADCRQHVSWTAAFWGILLLFSIAGIAASPVFSPALTRTGQFICNMSLLIALVFIFALSLQGTASMLLDPCQR
jgi:hypothetical protein